MHPEMISASVAGIESLLESLRFPGYKYREDSLDDATGDTFSWIHSKRAPGRARGASNVSTFPVWLQQSSNAVRLGQKPSVFWIKGKAASGKSTMMKRLVSSNKTSSMLSQLPGGLPVRIASFFFHELAMDPDHLENSIEGGLRSILYQLIKKDDALGEVLVNPDFVEFGEFRKWTLARLKCALTSLLTAARGRRTRICLFLDGLDEVTEEEQIVLAEFLRHTHEVLPEVLLCVSSRPTLSLTKWVPEVCQLDMAICNHQDIESFVKNRLHPFITDQRVIKRVCDSADGVFLQAYLVTWRLITARKLLKEDLSDERVIDECLADNRLNELGRIHDWQPNKGLDKSIRAILHAGDTNSRFYLHVAMMDMLTRDVTDVASMTAARLPESLANYTDFSEACDQTVQQVCTQSDGILVYKDRSEDLNGLTADKSAWGLRQPSRAQADGAQQDWLTTIAERQRIPLREGAANVVKHMHGEIHWLHRSVYESIKKHESDALGETEVASSLHRGRVGLLIHGPTQDWQRYDHDTFGTTAECVWRIIHRLKDMHELHEADNIYSELDNLRSYLLHFNPEEFGPDDFHSNDNLSHMLTRPPYLVRPIGMPSRLHSDAVFLSACAEKNLYDYVLSRVKKPGARYFIVLDARHARA